MSRLAAIAVRSKNRAEPHPDPAVRAARIEAHEVFDLLWEEGGWSRSTAYRWLSREMGYEFHFGNAEEDECNQARCICICMLEEMGLL